MALTETAVPVPASREGHDCESQEVNRSLETLSLKVRRPLLLALDSDRLNDLIHAQPVFLQYDLSDHEFILSSSLEMTLHDVVSNACVIPEDNLSAFSDHA